MDLLQQFNNFNSNLQQHMLKGGGPLGRGIDAWQQKEKRDVLDSQVDDLFDAKTGALTPEGLRQYERASDLKTQRGTPGFNKGITNKEFRQAIDEKLIGGATGRRQLERSGISVYDPATGLHRSGVDLLRAQELQNSRKKILIDNNVERKDLGAGFEGGFGVLDVSDDVFAAKVKSVADTKKRISEAKEFLTPEQISEAGGDVARLNRLIQKEKNNQTRSQSAFETETEDLNAMASRRRRAGVGSDATLDDILKAEGRIKGIEARNEDDALLGTRSGALAYNQGVASLANTQASTQSLINQDRRADTRLEFNMFDSNRNFERKNYEFDTNRADNIRARNQDLDLRMFELEMQKEMSEDARQQGMINNLLGGLFNLGSLL